MGHGSGVMSQGVRDEGLRIRVYGRGLRVSAGVLVKVSVRVKIRL